MAAELPLPPLPCLCASLRRAARAVTLVYDGELRAHGLRATQYTLLQVLAHQSGLTQRAIGALLAIDSTTLTRTLRPLEAKGWVRARKGEDRREVRWELTPAGRDKLERARPAWQRAQTRLRSRVEPPLLDGLLAGLTRMAGAAGEAMG